MSKKTFKVVAEVASREVTIHEAEGVDQITLKGKLKGFGQGFKDYIAKSMANVDVTVNTGQFPAGHPKAGRWAIQIMGDDFETQEDANTLADRMTPKLKGLVQSCGASMPLPPPRAKQ